MTRDALYDLECFIVQFDNVKFAHLSIKRVVSNDIDENESNSEETRNTSHLMSVLQFEDILIGNSI